VKAAKHRFTKIMLRDSSSFVVKEHDDIPMLPLPTWAQNTRGVEKICNFQQITLSVLKIVEAGHLVSLKGE